MVGLGCGGHSQMQEDECWVACIPFHLLQLGFYLPSLSFVRLAIEVFGRPRNGSVLPAIHMHS